MIEEKDILKAALHELELNTGIKAIRIKFEPVRAKYDAALTIEDTQFAVEIKRAVLKRNIGAIINQVQALADFGEPIFVGDYINDRVGERLRDAGINYLDTVGNAYLNQKPLFVLIKGNAKPKELLNPVDQAFTPNGLKVIFALLTHPDLVTAGTQRDIAGIANVALGGVGTIIKELIEKGFLRQQITNNKRHWNITQLPDLIEKWAEEYPKLRKKQFLGRYIVRDYEWWKNHDLTKYGIEFGGEIAGGEYTNYLKPEIATVYLDKAKKNTFLKTFRMAKATDINNSEGMLVEVLAQFWHNHEFITRNPTLAHPLITYADLIATADIRNIETAKIIRDNQIEKLINKVAHEN